jgi:DNA-binding beta-propeller fold protein YncE
VTVRALAIVAVSVALAASSCARGTRVTSFEIDGHPSAVTTVGNEVWVSDDTRHVIHVLDARDGESLAEIEVSRNPIALASGGGHVWAAHANGRLAAIDARERTVIEMIEIGGSLTGVAYAFGSVWVTDLEHDELVEVDRDEFDVADRIDIEDGAVRVAAGADRSLWVTNREDTVTQVVDGRVRAVRKVGNGPIGLAHDGRRLWVANSDDGSVSVLAGDGGERDDDVPAGRGPIAVAAFESGAWSVDQDDGTLTPLRDDARRIELGTHPRGAVAVEWFGHREIWVVGSNPDAVVRVQL